MIQHFSGIVHYFEDYPTCTRFPREARQLLPRSDFHGASSQKFFSLSYYLVTSLHVRHSASSGRLANFDRRSSPLSLASSSPVGIRICHASSFARFNRLPWSKGQADEIRTSVSFLITTDRPDVFEHFSEIPFIDKVCNRYSCAGTTCHARRELFVQNCHISSVLSLLKHNQGKTNDKFVNC